MDIGKAMESETDKHGDHNEKEWRGRAFYRIFESLEGQTVTD